MPPWLDTSGTPIPKNISLSPSEPSFTTETPVLGYYGVPLQTHLKDLGREIALPIEACVMMLLASGMKEEVGSPHHPTLPKNTSQHPASLRSIPRDSSAWQQVPRC